jgi:hypothetical protein
MRASPHLMRSSFLFIFDNSIVEKRLCLLYSRSQPREFRVSLGWREERGPHPNIESYSCAISLILPLLNFETHDRNL